MPLTEAQRRAITKYERANIKRYVVRLNKKTDSDLIAYLQWKKAQTEFKNALREKIK